MKSGQAARLPQIHSLLLNVIAFKCADPSQAGVCVCSSGGPHRPCGVRVLRRDPRGAPRGGGARAPHLSLRLLPSCQHPATRIALGSARPREVAAVTSGGPAATPGPSLAHELQPQTPDARPGDFLQLRAPGSRRQPYGSGAPRSGRRGSPRTRGVPRRGRGRKELPGTGRGVRSRGADDSVLGLGDPNPRGVSGICMGGVRGEPSSDSQSLTRFSAQSWSPGWADLVRRQHPGSFATISFST